MHAPIAPILLISGVAGSIVSGCSIAASRWPQVSGQFHSDARPSTCVKVLARTREAITISGTRDAESAQIRDFPYLRVNRFLAHLGSRFNGRRSGPDFEVWVDRLRKLDTEATRVELANMPDVERLKLSASFHFRDETKGGLRQRIDECAQTLRVTDLANATRREKLLKNAVVPDNYSGLARVAGVYPLTAIPVMQGWEQWRQINLATFDQPVKKLPVEGRLFNFVPRGSNGALTPDQVREIVERSRDPHLGIPEPRGQDLARLLSSFAPIWQVDVSGDYDRIGYPAWRGKPAEVRIDQHRPIVFTRVGHAVVENQILLQVVYAVWFQKRPRDGPLDLLGGHLDGVMWRVTFGADGRPVMYDSIHACGCYHLFFPLSAMRERKATGGGGLLSESPAIIRTAPGLAPGQRLILRLASRSHYIVGVTSAEPGTGRRNRVTYQFADENVLRSLPLPEGGRRSLYGEDGLVAGSERLERYVLWPMGIESTGAMRQWGSHATAFVGRRHFDNPRLLEEIFLQ